MRRALKKPRRPVGNSCNSVVEDALGEDIRPISVSPNTVLKICKELSKEGILQRLEGSPTSKVFRKVLHLKKGRKSIQYRLPMCDEDACGYDAVGKSLKAARFLIEQGFGGIMVGSDYGNYIAQVIAPRFAAELAGLKENDPGYKDTCHTIGDLCRSSPSALERVLDPAFTAQMARIAEYKNQSVNAGQLLLEYLEAALLIDVADGRLSRT
jgi:hypothetical protein